MAKNVRDFGGSDLLRVVKEMADSKGLSFDFLIKAVESAIEAVAHSKYGNRKIGVSVDRKTGILSFYREAKIIDQDDKEAADKALSDGYAVMSLDEAKKLDSEARIGDIVRDPLPPVDLDYGSARSAKTKVASLIQIEERRKQREEFQNKIGTMVYGHVDQVDHGDLIVNINGNEACVPRKNLIGREVFKQGDKIKASIESVRCTNSGPQIFLSRVSNDFLIGLFEQEIPEVCDGLVKIHSVSRDQGSRAKVAVFSVNKNIDPIGACIGIRGSRIKSITNELAGEKIDVIEYSSDIGTFIVNALGVSEVTKIIIHEDINQIDVVVPENKLNLAIGRRGQNIRLVSMIVGQRVKVVTDKEESARRTKELSDGAARFSEALDVEEIIGHLLFTEGFTSIEDIVHAPLYELMGIEGFSEDIAVELQLRAKNYLADCESKRELFITESGMDPKLVAITEFSVSDLSCLNEANVKTISDFADLSVDEFFEVSPGSSIERQRIAEIIIEIRKSLGWL